MKALKKVCVLLTALILSGTAGVSVFAGAEEQMTTAWLNAANQLWENDWISRDGKIDYLEDSVSSIEEKLNSYDNCKVERINENKIGLVHYEPYFSFYVAASDSEYDSSNGLVTVRQLDAGSSQYYNTDHEVNGAYPLVKGCELFTTLNDFCNQYGITQEMIDWVNPAGEGFDMRDLTEGVGPSVNVSYYDYNDSVLITLEAEPEEGSSVHGNWTEAKFSFHFGKKYTDEYVLQYMNIYYYNK